MVQALNCRPALAGSEVPTAKSSLFVALGVRLMEPIRMVHGEPPSGESSASVQWYGPVTVGGGYGDWNVTSETPPSPIGRATTGPPALQGSAAPADGAMVRSPSTRGIPNFIALDRMSL